VPRCRSVEDFKSIGRDFIRHSRYKSTSFSRKIFRKCLTGSVTSASLSCLEFKGKREVILSESYEAMISEIQNDLEKTKAETSIFELANFHMRADAIDFIDFHVIDRIEGLIQQIGQKEELIQLRMRANRLKNKLEDIDREMFRHLEQQISRSKHKGFVLRKIIDGFFKACYYDIGDEDTGGYDNFDIFLNRLLSTSTIHDVTHELEPEMVFYQKTPGRIIVELSKSLNQNDVFFDIGSGVGQVVILVNIMCDAKAIGIEFEPSFCNYADSVASKFDLVHVQFINEDARKVDYSKGSVFFLYTPFIGKMMQDVLALLRKVSLKNVIRIFSYGPCSRIIAQENWLTCRNGNADGVYKLYEFQSFARDNFF